MDICPHALAVKTLPDLMLGALMKADMFSNCPLERPAQPAHFKEQLSSNGPM